MQIRVLLADDNTLFREGMASILNRCEGVEVIGQAKDGGEVVRKAAVLRPTVVLMDIGMPLGGGVEATRRILAERPTQAICMLTASEQEHDLYASIRAGARGYLVKTVPMEELEQSLHILASGGSVITPHLGARLLQEFNKLSDSTPGASGEADKLTARERIVLELVTRGASNREIADELLIAHNTVKVHLRNIMGKLHLRNRQQAAAFAVQQGLVHVNDKSGRRV